MWASYRSIITKMSYIRTTATSLVSIKIPLFSSMGHEGTISFGLSDKNSSWWMCFFSHFQLIHLVQFYNKLDKESKLLSFPGLVHANNLSAYCYCYRHFDTLLVRLLKINIELKNICGEKYFIVSEYNVRGSRICWDKILSRMQQYVVS